MDIQRAEVIQFLQTVDGKRYKNLEKCLDALITHFENWDCEEYKKYSIFNVKRGNVKNRLRTVYGPVAYIFHKDPNSSKKCTLLALPVNSKKAH